MKTNLQPWKTNLEPFKTMKNQSGTKTNHENQPRTNQKPWKTMSYGLNWIDAEFFVIKKINQKSLPARDD